MSELPERETYWEGFGQAMPRRHRTAFLVPRLDEHGVEQLTWFKLDVTLRTTDSKEHTLAALTHIFHELTEFVSSDATGPQEKSANSPCETIDQPTKPLDM